MRLIGMTGRSGSGKTTVGVLAHELGIPVLDCDAIYRELTSKPTACLMAIRDTFGAETVRNNALYRPALREKVFSDRDAMQKLNAITAEHMAREINARLRTMDAPLVILDAPTLFESGLHSVCDRLIGVVSSDEACMKRIMMRDGIDESAAKARLNQQHTKEYFFEYCDIVIQNDSDEETLREKARKVLFALQKGEI